MLGTGLQYVGFPSFLHMKFHIRVFFENPSRKFNFH